MQASFERHNGAADAGIHAYGGQPESERQGDLRGRYGYGRPAHGADPKARYGFDINLLEGRRSR